MQDGLPSRKQDRPPRQGLNHGDGQRCLVLMLLAVALCLLAASSGAASSGAASIGTAEAADPEAPGLSAGERLEALVARVEAQRSNLQSLKARFRERKESPLLLEPEEATGEFLFVAPDRARWTLEAPQDTLIVVQGEQMLTWYRHLGTAERVQLGSQGERLLQFFGPGSSLEKLRRYFDLRFTRSGDPDVPYRMELLPRSRRVARRVRHLTLDIDRQLFLPIHVRFEEASGATTEYWFSDLESNVEVPAELFEVQLPPEVEVRDVVIGSPGGRR